MLSRHRGEEIDWGLCVSRLVKVKTVPLHAKQAQRGGNKLGPLCFQIGKGEGCPVTC